MARKRALAATPITYYQEVFASLQIQLQRMRLVSEVGEERARAQMDGNIMPVTTWTIARVSPVTEVQQKHVHKLRVPGRFAKWSVAHKGGVRRDP